MPEPSSSQSAASLPTGAVSDGDLARIDARLRQSETVKDETLRALENESRRRELDDRSKIAKLIVNVFVFSSAGVLLLICAGTAFSVGGWTAWQDVAEFCLKVLSSVLLPVVTLVIGYYFGKEK